MADTIYRADLSCDYEEWWRYNIFMTVVEYDAGGKMTGYRNVVDRVYDVDDGSDDRVRPSDYPSDRKASITTEPCNRIEIYLYVITNTFPASEIIRESPPFPARLTVTCDGEVLVDKEFPVNQWGGLTLVGFPVPNDAD